MGAFNFSAAIAASQKDLKNDCLNLIILGSSGNGKSYALGTFGVKTLYLYTTKEDHGPKSATASAERLGTENVVPIRLDVSDTGEALSADATMERLLSILRDVRGIQEQGFGAVAIDGGTELEEVIKNTSEYKALLAAKYKGQESFAGPLVLSAFRPIVAALKTLRNDANVHGAMTVILDVLEYDASGAIVAAKPSLAGYGVATGLCQMFGDIVVVGKVKRPDGTEGYPFQMGALVTRTTKDFQTKEVRKTHNFNIRLTGCDMSTFPEMMASDLSQLIRCKKAKKYVE